MTVGAFLEFVAGMRGLSRPAARERLGELVERIDLAEVWGRRIEALSKGFKRRVGIAQALVHDPDVLILDEPTDGLDPNQKHEMRELIRTLADREYINFPEYRAMDSWLRSLELLTRRLILAAALAINVALQPTGSRE